ncbi:MAG: CinA family protein [Campylobacter sp.]|nr:CinA family protein [Campylobacter sp.]
MKHLLFIIGDELIMSQNYKEYIYRAYEQKFEELGEVRIQSKTDKELPFLLEKLIEQYEFITLFADEQCYSTIAKILATLNEDNLILKDETLVPDKAIFAKNSFVSDFKNCKINVLKVNTEEKLPPLLGELTPNFKYFCLFGIDDESALILLETLRKSYEVNIKASKLLADLTLMKISSLQHGKIEGFLQSVQNLFGSKVFLGKNPIHFIVNKLLEKRLKISFAESCTGGNCAAELTKISGVSEIFEGSIVSYSNRLKHEWLGISESVLEGKGVYSERCIYFMLKGIFKTAKPDFALAISGIAGEQDEQGIKAGSVYIGAMFKDGAYIQETLYIKGDREFIQKQAVLGAFYLMFKLKPEIFEF